MRKVLVVATSRKTRGGITSVVKAHETGEQWKKYHCQWIETHRDGPAWRKVWYFMTALIHFCVCLPSCDMLHVHSADGATASASRKKVFVYIAHVFHKKIIIHLHLGDEKKILDPTLNRKLLQLLHYADCIIVLSPQWKRWLLEVMPEAEPIVRVLYNPCITVNRNTAIKKKKQILLAGTICKRKGYDVALKAFASIAKKYPDWMMAFAGNPYLLEGFNELEDGKRLAKEYGIESQVKWLGWVSGPDKERVFNESSIYCLASNGEGFPMGVLDAWAYGLPCVMTPVGGIPDIVVDGKEGLLFPIGDDVKMAEALEKLIRDVNLRKSIVVETDKLAATTFNKEVICQQLDLIYKDVLNIKN